MKRAIWLLAAGALAMLCVFLWRLSMIALRLEEAVIHTSGNVKQVSDTAAAISRRVDQIDARFEEFDRRFNDALPIQEMANALDDLGELRTHPEIPDEARDPAMDGEIAYLFQHIARSGLRFEYSGKDRSAGSFRILLTAKYRVYRKIVDTTEAFISRVATKTPGGDTYYVLLPDSERQELAAWLTEALRAYRIARNANERDGKS